MKNTLQQIEGLIAIEGRTITDPGALHAFESLTGRVRAMGAVHQRLIGSRNLSDISVHDFISDLCVDLAFSQGTERRGISIRVEAEAGDINIEHGVVLGLLVNELVTNALKHAFPDGRRGEIIASYKRSERQNILEVRDNGVGLPLEVARSGHTGFRLIEGFVDQLYGHLTIDRSSGTAVQITFPERAPPSGQLR